MHQCVNRSSFRAGSNLKPRWRGRHLFSCSKQSCAAAGQACCERLLALSFWLVANLPLDGAARQRPLHALSKSVTESHHWLQGARGDTPLALSFWLAANLPLDDAARQRLLEAHSAAERLYHALRIMQALQLSCCECEAEASCYTAL